MSEYFDSYFRYLQKRSWKGRVYRNWVLYPRIRRFLSGRILDVGCGVGDFLSFEPSARGADINPKLVEYCRARGLHAELMDSDSRIPYPDQSFDSVLLDNVLEHVEGPQGLLLDISRVLVQGGGLIVGVPGRKGHAADPDHKVYYDERSLVETVERSGFSCDRVFATPLRRSTFLSSKLRIYCTYALFLRH